MTGPLSLGNFFAVNQMNGVRNDNTITGIAKRIMDNSGWNTPSAKTSNNFTLNKPMFESLGDLKSVVTSLNNAMSSLASLNEYSSLINKSATLSNDDVLSADVTNDAAVSNFTKTSVNVTALAQGQQNEGNALSADDISFDSQFSINITDNQGKVSTFEVNIGDNDTNKTALQSMAEQINSANIGVKARLVEDAEQGTVSMQLESEKSGLSNKFTVDDTSAAGLNNIISEAANAKYTVNGKSFESETNENVSLLKGVTANLQQTGQVDMTYKREIGDATSLVQNFLNDYNNLKEATASNLLNQFNLMENSFGRALEASGLGKDDAGKLFLKDQDTFKNSVFDGDFSKNFQGLNSFGNNLHNIARNAYNTMYTSAIKENFQNFVNSQSTVEWNDALNTAFAYSGLLLNVLA